MMPSLQQNLSPGRKPESSRSANPNQVVPEHTAQAIRAQYFCLPDGENGSSLAGSFL
jgi:hypothetical protein